MEATDGEVGCTELFYFAYIVLLMVEVFFYWQSLNCEFCRRRQLAQLGSASGVYKTLVKYLAGVPEVLTIMHNMSLLCRIFVTYTWFLLKTNMLSWCLVQRLVVNLDKIPG